MSYTIMRVSDYREVKQMGGGHMKRFLVGLVLAQLLVPSAVPETVSGATVETISTLTVTAYYACPTWLRWFCGE